MHDEWGSFDDPDKTQFTYKEIINANDTEAEVNLLIGEHVYEDFMCNLRAIYD